MADDSDRVIPATPRRREVARREGLMPAAALPAWVATVGTTVFLGPTWASATIDAATGLVRETFVAAGRGPGAEPPASASVIAVALPTAAVVVAAAAAGLGVRFVLDGVSWQPGRVVPAYRRIDLLAGFGRIFSFRTLASACGAGLCLAVLATASALAMHPLVAAKGADPMAAFVVAWQRVAGLLAVAAAVAVVAWLAARRRFERRIRMTPDELAEEAKSAGADPKIRLFRQESRRQPPVGAA